MDLFVKSVLQEENFLSYIKTLHNSVYQEQGLNSVSCSTTLRLEIRVAIKRGKKKQEIISNSEYKLRFVFLSNVISQTD